jgi:hypothetical protein
MSQRYREEANEVAREYHLPLIADDPIGEEIRRRGLRIEPFLTPDAVPPYDQGVRLRTAEGLVVAEAVTRHEELSAIEALRSLLELERTDGNSDGNAGA